MADDDRGRPGEKAPHRSNGDTSRIPPAGDSQAHPALTDNMVFSTTDNTVLETAYAEWWAVFVAESDLLLEQLALDALRALSVEQLQGLIWIGLLDEGWSRVVTELDERAERGEAS